MAMSTPPHHPRRNSFIVGGSWYNNPGVPPFFGKSTIVIINPRTTDFRIHWTCMRFFALCTKLMKRSFLLKVNEALIKQGPQKEYVQDMCFQRTIDYSTRNKMSKHTLSIFKRDENRLDNYARGLSCG